MERKQKLNMQSQTKARNQGRDRGMENQGDATGLEDQGGAGGMGDKHCKYRKI